MKEPKLYIEQPERILGGFLEDNAYAEAIKSFIIVCTDFVAIDQKRGVFYLAKRIVHPTEGIWLFGGRQKAGETTRESCIRLAKRELGLSLSPARFEYVTVAEELWSWRKLEPHDAGCHTLSYIFCIELSKEEIAFAATHLDPEEYEITFGIQEFDRTRIVAETVYPRLIDLYDSIFPSA